MQITLRIYRSHLSASDNMSRCKEADIQMVLAVFLLFKEMLVRS
jgi:hypothetical protein